MSNIISDYLETYYPEVSCKEFYRDIFPVGSLQKKRISKDDYGDDQKYKYNGILIEVTDQKIKYIDENGIEKEKVKVNRYTVTDDLNVLDEIINSKYFCLMSPISYIGKKRDSKNARDLYAITFDVDGIQTQIEDGKEFPYGLANMFYQMFELQHLPIPTYIVSSGTGVHIYYVLERSVSLFPNVVEEISRLREGLTKKLWHDSISSLMDKIQYEPVWQGFRVPGTITKRGERTRVFKVGEKVTIEYLNEFVLDQYKVKEFTYTSSLSLSRAKELYPEWYEKRIIQKQPRNTWIFNRRVYDSWYKRIYSESSVGHRYWAIWVLAVTAKKCDISEEELTADAFNLLDRMNEIDKSHNNPFTADDILSALQGYDSHWMTYPVEKMSYRTDIQLPVTKRNGRKQKQHIKIMNAIRDIEYPDGSWREGNGRKSKKDIVQNWKKENPNGRKVDCIRDTKLDKKTVYKWW